MKRMLVAMAGVAALSTAGAPLAAADIGGAIDVEHARATARAGGPISDYDAELLDRWGNSSGGPDWRKLYRVERGYDYGAPVRVHRHKKHRRVYRD
ncbi:MAG: hypothetical protein HOP09_13320 [Hyphomicrobium sp.]|nr:hypothetical protein [Hyphomicrobium sp.]